MALDTTAAAVPAPTAAPATVGVSARPTSPLPDKLFDGLLVVLACSVLAALLLVTYQLYSLARPAIAQFGFGFLTSSDWDPTSGLFGAFPFLTGTLLTAFEALIVAVPLGIGTAIFLSEMADKRFERWVRFPIEMLAAVPSVVYGLWGLGRLAPLLREHVEPLLAKTGLPIFAGPQLGVGVLAAGLVLAVMVFPTVVALRAAGGLLRARRHALGDGAPRALALFAHGLGRGGAARAGAGAGRDHGGRDGHRQQP